MAFVPVTDRGVAAATLKPKKVTLNTLHVGQIDHDDDGYYIVIMTYNRPEAPTRPVTHKIDEHDYHSLTRAG